MKKIIMAAALGAIGFAAAGCELGSAVNSSYVGTEVGLSRAATVAVLPFENLTSHQGAGLAASELASTEMYRLRLFQQVEPTRARHLLAAAKVDVEHLTETGYAQKAAQLLEVDAVLVGSVTEFGYQHGLREEATVGMNARLVRAKDGVVVWAGSRASMGTGALMRESVAEVALRAMQAMLASLDGAVR